MAHSYPRRNRHVLPDGDVQKACPRGGGESVQSCPEPCRRKGRSPFGPRSVLPVRENGTRARTPLAAFFNISHLATVHQHVETYGGPNGSAVQVGPLRQTTDGPGRLGTVWRISFALNLPHQLNEVLSALRSQKDYDPLHIVTHLLLMLLGEGRTLEDLRQI